GLSPRDLLVYAHATEDRLGRTRTVKNGPRTCDIDILDYQCYVYESEELTLPHPLLTERDFVVKPLLELRPGHVLADDTPVVEDTVKVGHATRIRQGF
ncbi:MAG: 2-amino-4-hydroxy-6-hydroxymethyldihydropteridine diphosphokinase, partial [Raoultibacter sp.]